MSVQENKAVVHDVIAAVNNRDLDAFDVLLAPDLAQSWKEIIPQAYQRFARHHATITDLIAEGDQAVARLATRGRHTGEWRGIPPTGKQWTNTGVHFYRLAEGKIVELASLFDQVNLLRQLGATIAPSEQGGG